jgi:branched-chain amino acid transport system substrate-binding protein
MRFGTANLAILMAGLLLGVVSLALKPAVAEERPLKIGVMLCLTGDCAEWGTNGLKGAQLAAEELNRRGGVLGQKVELVVQDSRDTVPASSVSAFQKLAMDPEIHYIVGPTWTVGGMPIAPLVARRKDIIMMSPSLGVKEFNETADNIFNDWPHDEVATRALAQYAAGRRWKKAAIFGSQDPFYITQTRIFEEEFGKLGGLVAEKVEPLPDSRELKTEALKIKQSNPDFVMLTNYQADVIALELRRIGFGASILAVQMEKNRVKDAQGALDGAIFAMYDKPAKGFSKSFADKFKHEPGISADTAYDVVGLFARAIEQARTTGTEKTKQVLLSTRNYQGASGTFSIDDKGAVDKKPVLWEVRGLDYERVAAPVRAFQEE